MLTLDRALYLPKQKKKLLQNNNNTKSKKLLRLPKYTPHFNICPPSFFMWRLWCQQGWHSRKNKRRNKIKKVERKTTNGKITVDYMPELAIGLY